MRTLLGESRIANRIVVDTHGTRNPKCSAVSSRTGKPYNRYAIAGGSVSIMHGGGAPRLRRLPRAGSGPWLTQL